MSVDQRAKLVEIRAGEPIVADDGQQDAEGLGAKERGLKPGRHELLRPQARRQTQHRRKRFDRLVRPAVGERLGRPKRLEPAADLDHVDESPVGQAGREGDAEIASRPLQGLSGTQPLGLVATAEIDGPLELERVHRELLGRKEALGLGENRVDLFRGKETRQAGRHVVFVVGRLAVDQPAGELGTIELFWRAALFNEATQLVAERLILGCLEPGQQAVDLGGGLLRIGLVRRPAATAHQQKQSEDRQHVSHGRLIPRSGGRDASWNGASLQPPRRKKGRLFSSTSSASPASASSGPVT